MAGSVSRRVSNGSNLTVDSGGDSLGLNDRSPPQNLESQFLRQPHPVSQHTPVASLKGGIAARDATSVNSYESAGMMRSSQASQISQASALTTGSEKPVRKKRTANPGVVYTPATLNYHNINIYQAANQGNLPVVVLLWSMAANKKINLMSPDFQGNNPMHYACLADSSEVSFFFFSPIFFCSQHPPSTEAITHLASFFSSKNSGHRISHAANKRVLHRASTSGGVKKQTGRDAIASGDGHRRQRSYQGNSTYSPLLALHIDIPFASFLIKSIHSSCLWKSIVR